MEENYYYNKLKELVKIAWKVKIFDGRFKLDYKIISILPKYFDKNNPIENHILNFFDHSIYKINKYKAGESILLGDFIFSLSYGIAVALMKGDENTIILFREMNINIKYFIDKETKNDISNYKKLKELIGAKYENLILNLDISTESSIMHKRVFMQALLFSKKEPNLIGDFRLNYLLNVVKSLEMELALFDVA